MELARLRNLGIVAHIDAGKTTLTERILFCTGTEHRVGEVDEGTSVMDWMAEERERGITITAAATRVAWGDAVLQLIDTPGHVDFTMEVERCMRVLDGALLVVDAVAGVQAQTETVWRQLRNFSVPSLAFVNKCDRVGADYLAAVASLRERLQAPALAVQYPVYEEGALQGVVDLLGRRAILFQADGTAAEAEVPADVSDEIEVLRAELIDFLAASDERVLEALVEERDPPVDVLREALRRRTLAGEVVPALCGAALRGIGVQPLLDAVVEYLPSPLDVPPVPTFDPDGHPGTSLGPDAEGPLAALVFKLHVGAHGDLVLVRVYSGTVRPGDKLWNPRTRRMERAARILRMHGETGASLERALPGEIIALTGLKDTSTGDTLCDRARPLLLEPPRFPEPVIALVVEPTSSADRDKLRQVLARLSHEDPSFHAREDVNTGQWLIEGMGELHLEVQLHRVQTEFKIRPRVGEPRVSYREAVRSAGRGAGKVDRVLAGKPFFGAVELELVPDPEASGLPVEWAPECPVPRAFRAGIEESLRLEAQSGPRFGFPLVGGRVRLTGGETRERGDSEPAFAQAAAHALRQAMQAADVALLEPTMTFEIQTPEEFASGILADLGGRRAEVEGVRAERDQRSIHGQVPLARMFGYSTVVRSLSQGRASYVLKPAGFRAVPDEELEARGLVWS